MKAAEELCKRALKRDENKVAQCWNRNDEQDGKSKKEKERKKSMMKETSKLRNWDPGGERLQSGCELAELKVENKQSKIQSTRAKDEVIVGTTDIHPMADHLDLFQHMYRVWNEKADRLTHEARQKGARSNSFTMKEGSKVEAVRACFDGEIEK